MISPPARISREAQCKPVSRNIVSQIATGKLRESISAYRLKPRGNPIGTGYSIGAEKMQPQGTTAAYSYSDAIDAGVAYIHQLLYIYILVNN